MSVVQAREMLPVKIAVGAAGPGGSIEIGGVDLSRFVTGFELSADVNEVTHLTVHFIKVEVDAEGLVDTTGLGDLWTNYRRAKELKEGDQT